jgi:hypothetical protein
MAKHKVNWHLKGKRDYRAGDVIDLKAEDAAPLVALGVITPIDEAAVDTEVETLTPSALKKLSREQLAAYAKHRYSLNLNIMEATKDSMLAAVAVCAAEEDAETE